MLEVYNLIAAGAGGIVGGVVGRVVITGVVAAARWVRDFTWLTIAEDTSWRCGNGAPIYDIAGNRLQLGVVGAGVAVADDATFAGMSPSMNSGDDDESGRCRVEGSCGCPLAGCCDAEGHQPDDGVCKTLHGITTASSGPEVVAVCNTALGPLTLSLQRPAGWQGGDGVEAEIAAVLRCCADQTRALLSPCGDCGGVGEVHTADCDAWEGSLDMGVEAMTKCDDAPMYDQE